MEAAEILGLDIGLKHTGIARASNIARIAEPLKTVPTEDVVKTIAEYIQAHKVESIAVGLPRNLSGEDTRQTDWVRQWVDKTKTKITTPLYWQDEALTSIEARIKNNELRIKTDEHALAAAVILQDFLDTPEAERVVC